MRKNRMAGALALLTCFVMVFVAGCGSSNANSLETNLKVGKNGDVTSNIVESFDKEYYSIDGLQSMIQEEIDAYANSLAITLTTVEIPEEQEGLARVVMTFASGEDYGAFNEVDCFYGTVAQAQAAGYDFAHALVSVSKDGETLSKDALEDMAEYHVFIIGESIQVSLPAKVLYMSEGAELVNNKCINTQQSGELTYVIMK